MKYIASISYGKDSLAMLIKLKELNYPIDEVLCVDVMFNESIPADKPEMVEFIKQADIILKDKFDVEVKHIKGPTFCEVFYSKNKKGKYIGNIHGYPLVFSAWCNSFLKVDPLNKYIKSLGEDVISYVGIAYDEPDRYNSLDKTKCIAPLYDLKIDQKETKRICEKNNLLSPAYKSQLRTGCWFCVKQNDKSLRLLIENNYEYFQMLKDMEKDSAITFRPGYTLE